MSPMLDIQRRHAEVFRIRLGDKGAKGQPQKLTDSIRLTSASRAVVEAFTEVYGGTPKPWEQQWEAYLPVTELPIMVLPGQSITQWWELYKGSVCDRRCDGDTETLSGTDCKCPSDITVRMQTAGACRPMTRVNVICPEVAVVGAGSLVSHGLIAAETLPQAIAVAEAALQRGLMVPGVLRVVEHKSKRHYVVPQIEIVGVSLNALATGEASPAPVAIDVPEARAIEAPAQPALPAGGGNRGAESGPQPDASGGSTPSSEAPARRAPAAKKAAAPAPATPPLPGEQEITLEKINAELEKLTDEFAAALKEEWKTRGYPPKAKLGKGQYLGVHDMVQWFVRRQEKAYLARRIEAIDALKSIGIVEEEDRHAFVEDATAGLTDKTNSTKALTKAQLSTILSVVEEIRKKAS
jgi:hypothetical protein